MADIQDKIGKHQEKKAKEQNIKKKRDMEEVERLRDQEMQR